MARPPNQRLAWAGLAVAVVVWAVLLRFPPDRSGFYPVCPFHAAAGLLCPGCGGTRAIAALLHGDLRAAWRWNPLVAGLVPFALAYAVETARRKVWIALPRAVWITLAVVTAAFGVMRNLDGLG